MNIDIKAVHFDLHDETKELIEKRSHKLEFAQELIVDLLFTLTKQKSTNIAETNINFRWGTTTHIKTESYDLHESIDKLFDKIEHKVHKEKDKIQQH
jgi:putative sigma-54 modulation protein